LKKISEDCAACLSIGRYLGHEVINEVADKLRVVCITIVLALQDGGHVTLGFEPVAEPPRHMRIDFINVRGGHKATPYAFLNPAAVRFTFVLSPLRSPAY